MPTLQNWQKSILPETSGPRAPSCRRLYFPRYVFLIWMKESYWCGSHWAFSHSWGYYACFYICLMPVDLRVRVCCRGLFLTSDVISLWIGRLNRRSVLSWSEEAACCLLDSQLELLAVRRLHVLPLCARGFSPGTSHTPKTSMIWMISSSWSVWMWVYMRYVCRPCYEPLTCPEWKQVQLFQSELLVAPFILLPPKVGNSCLVVFMIILWWFMFQLTP